MQSARYRVRPKKRRYKVNKKRFHVFITLLAVLITLIFLWKHQKQEFYAKYRVSEFDDKHLEMYFDVEVAQGVPWYYMLATDRAEGIPKEEVSKGRSEQIALHLRGITSTKDIGRYLAEYNNDPNFIKKIEEEIKHLRGIIKIYEDKVFPISGHGYHYSNDFGAGRSYGGDRLHEGIDLMCEIGTPILTVCDGIVEQKGWLELGGWRLGIRGDDGIYYYYAHLSRYEEGLEKGHKVKKGQIIGYAGDTGYGTEGTTGQFEPHLHFGMYEKDDWVNTVENAINPYPFLKAWERKYP